MKRNDSGDKYRREERGIITYLTSKNKHRFSYEKFIIIQ